MATSSAVLMLVFNRPSTTEMVFEAVRRAQPPRLYIAADGPRHGNVSDKIQCQQVRQIFEKIDWPCQLNTRYLERNLGCRMAVSSAISWFFEHEEEGIILEDDTLPNSSFFEFCDAMLERYRDELKVFSVCGSNLANPWFDSRSDYFFTRYMCVWGWASWRRAWKMYDESLSDWPQLSAQGHQAIPLLPTGFAKSFWTLVFDLVHLRSIGTWDHQWVFAHWKNDALSIVPSKNMVLNLGFGTGATHTSGSIPTYAQKMRLQELRAPYKGPLVIQDDFIFAQVMESRVHNIGLFAYLKLGVRKSPRLFGFLKKHVERLRRWRAE